MRVIEPSFEISPNTYTYGTMLAMIEKAGRVCYKSVPNNEKNSEKFITRLIKSGHDSVIEHISITVKIICDRGVSHELVRHRLCSFSQESTRYCNYSKEKFGKTITVIMPLWYIQAPNSPRRVIWEKAMESAEQSYFNLLEAGAKAQEARSVLPNSLKTEIVVTANIREWRHIFNLRAAPLAHPDMSYIMLQVQSAFKQEYPVFFQGGEK